MEPQAHLWVIYHFFLDGAKIIFGSLVVGLFIPSAIPSSFPLFTFASGLALTTFFLIVAQAALKRTHHTIADL